MHLFKNSLIGIVPYIGRQSNCYPENLLLKKKAVDNSSYPYKFAYARTALKYGLVSVGIKPGDSLLIPDLICVSALESFDLLGVNAQFYSINTMLEPDFNSIKKNITKTTKALLIVHYFGQPQQIEECVEFCKKNSLLLIEDNAHGFGATLHGQLLGTFGAIGISSPRKSFPINNGAYLYISDKSKIIMPTLLLDSNDKSSRYQYIKFIIKRIPLFKTIIRLRRKISENLKRFGPVPLYGSQKAFRNFSQQHEYGMDISTEMFIQKQNIDNIREARHQIYDIWQQWAEKKGITSVFPKLSPGAMPLVFPAFTDSIEDSLNWYDRGHRAGVDIHSWPTLPLSIVKKNGNAMRIWERMLCFPIHQGMDIKLLEKRLNIL